jgi:hypothetical protein
MEPADLHQPSLDHRATVPQVPQHVTIAMPVPQGTLPGRPHRSSVAREEDVSATVLSKVLDFSISVLLVTSSKKLLSTSCSMRQIGNEEYEICQRPIGKPDMERGISICRMGTWTAHGGSLL